MTFHVKRELIDFMVNREIYFNVAGHEFNISLLKFHRVLTLVPNLFTMLNEKVHVCIEVKS